MSLGTKFVELLSNEAKDNPKAAAMWEACLAVARHRLHGAIIAQEDTDLFWQAIREFSETVGFPVRDSFVDGVMDALSDKVKD